MKFNVGVVVMVAVAVGLAALAIFLARQSTLVAQFALYAAMFSIFAAIGATKLIPRFDFLTFTDHWKRPLFSIARERGQTEECDTFVADLLNRIELAEKGQGNATYRAIPKLLEGTDPKPEWLWKMAVISGGVTLAYPTLARWFSELSGIVLPVVLAGATTAIVATFYSYGAKERHRHWCLVGLALAALTFIVFD